jgi:hypothetical protein
MVVRVIGAKPLLQERIGRVHPSKYADEISDADFEEADVLFYREVEALFNAKPDFLVLIPQIAVWIEAKAFSSFSSAQTRRMRNIATFCASPLFDEYFRKRRPAIFLLDFQCRHHKAQAIVQYLFLSWERCAQISAKLFSPSDITARVLRNLVDATRKDNC